MFKGLKIVFHQTYLLVALGFVLTGNYLNLLVFTSLILVHELGHYLVARANGIGVREIVVYPYGGMTKLEDKINLDINRELLVATSGVIFQYLFYLGVSYLFRLGVIREYTYSLYTLYNKEMIFFNLLPIYPLDGGRIMNLLLSKIMAYNWANVMTIGLSVGMLGLIMGFNIYKANYSNVMVMGVVIVYLYQFYRKRKYLYQRFLVERYLYELEFDDVKVIRSIKGMFKDKSHLIWVGDRYFMERDVLEKLFRRG